MAQPENSLALAPASLRAYCYLVTIKCNKVDYTSRDQLDVVYECVKRRLPKGHELGMIAYELDSLKRWHKHFILQTKREPYFKLFQIRGWTIHFQLFDKKDDQRIRDYLNKCPQNRYQLEQLDIESYYYYCNDPFAPQES